MRFLLLVTLLGISPAGADDSKSTKLVALRAQYDTKVTEASSAFDNFNRLYFTQLEKLLATAKEEGNLDLALAARTEQEAFRDRGEDFPEPSKLPALAKLQKIYAEQYPKLVAEKNAKLVPIRAAYSDQLDALIRELTKEENLDAAVEAQKELTTVKELIRTVASQGKKGLVTGRYVRVELMKKQILSLAEVEIFNGGRNIALKGTATQSSTLRDSAKPTAEKAIDGNTNGEFREGSTTHTEADDNPWWEVDLHKERDLTKVVVWNRNEAQKRLDGFKLSILDEDRRTVWKTEVPKAPMQSIEIELVPSK